LSLLRHLCSELLSLLRHLCSELCSEPLNLLRGVLLDLPRQIQEALLKKGNQLSVHVFIPGQGR
jgi:hypothetical protein